MNILFLSPQPFFVERGTPIAVKLALQVLGERPESNIDLLTYHEGQDIELKNVNHHRACIPGIVKNIGPGLSVKKLICDIFFTLSALNLVFFSNKKYDLIHAVEESVFIAWFIKKVKNIPYVYDMDSALALQSSDKWHFLKPFMFLLEHCEKTAVKNSAAALPVCDALADLAKDYGAQKTQILRDISLLDKSQERTDEKDIRKIIKAQEEDLIILYIGNLEVYQGIDLLIESFSKISEESPQAKIVIIGGNQADIQKYTDKAEALGITEQCSLLGPKPVSDLSIYLLQADILASPRTQGNNTPMKIYSYLHSGVPIIATDLPTHTQVLNTQVAQLAKPNTDDFSKKLKELINNQTLRFEIGQQAIQLAEENYTYDVYQNNLNKLYTELGANF